MRERRRRAGARGRGPRRGWRRLGAAALLAAWAGLGAACGDEPEPRETGAAIPEATGPRDVAVIEVEGMGTIRVELLPELAPETVARFERLAREGYYDGTTFHRVVPEFMIQGGDPNSRDRDPRNDGQGGRAQEMALEASDVGFGRGVVGMANRGFPDTSGPQFFITVEDSPHLNGQFTLFGRVVEGMDVVDAIARVSRDTYGRYGPENRPLEDVVMTSVRIEEAAARATSGGDASAPGGPAEDAPAPADGADDLGGGEWREGAP